MKRKSLLFVLPLIALVLMSCRFGTVSINNNSVSGSGQLKTETRDVSDIERVSLEDLGDVTLIQGNEEGLTVEADDNLLPYIETIMQGHELVLRIKHGTSITNHPTIHYTVKVKDLSRVAISGSGSITAKQLKVNDFEMDISGSGDVNLPDLEAKSLQARASGSGNFNLKGKADSQDVTITGAGNYTAGDLESSEANVTISGAGNVTIWATNKLSVRITGFGNVNYYGKPTVEQNITGGGSIKTLGEHK